VRVLIHIASDNALHLKSGLAMQDYLLVDVQDFVDSYVVYSSKTMEMD